MGIFCCCVGCCFSSGTSKSLEVLLIVIHSVSFALTLVCLIIMKWKEIYISNLIFFIIMLIISVICLLFSILIRYWRSEDLIKNSKRNIGTTLCTTSIVLVVIHFVLSVIEEIIFSISYNKVNYPCKSHDYSTYNSYYYRRLKSDYNCASLGSDYDTKIIPFYQYFIVYASITYLEVALILKMCVWYLLRTRVINGLDSPLDNPITNDPQVPQANYPGRTVVVIQEHNMVQNSPYIYNQQIYSNDGLNPNNQNVYYK